MALIPDASASSLGSHQEHHYSKSLGTKEIIHPEILHKSEKCKDDSVRQDCTQRNLPSFPPFPQ